MERGGKVKKRRGGEGCGFVREQTYGGCIGHGDIVRFGGGDAIDGRGVANWVFCARGGLRCGLF